MKVVRPLLLLLLTLWSALPASSCIFEITHNYYLYRILPDAGEEPTFLEQTVEDWARYVDRPTDDIRYRLFDFDRIDFAQWDTTSHPLIAAVRRKHDTERLDYLKNLALYQHSIATLHPQSWDYPTAEALTQARTQLAQVGIAARGYRGRTLAAQYALLQARCAFEEKRYQDVVDLWKTTGKSLPDSPYKAWMRNLYAGALLRTGHRAEAVDIYAEQGDMQSLRWAVRDERNLAGIRRIYAENPNSPLLPYLVQDFVNNAQETLDQIRESGAEVQDEPDSWMRAIGRRVVGYTEADDFVRWAQKVVGEKRTRVPSMWLSAAALLSAYHKDYTAALALIEAAQQADGTTLMQSNARALRLYIVLRSTEGVLAAASAEVDEVKWLTEMANRDEHMARVKDRIVYEILYPKFKQQGLHNAAVAVLGWNSDIKYRVEDTEEEQFAIAFPETYEPKWLTEMAEQNAHMARVKERIPYDVLFPRFKQQSLRNDSVTVFEWNNSTKPRVESSEEGHFAYAYGNDYAQQLDTLSAEQTIDYVNYLNTSPNSRFEALMLDSLSHDRDYFNDLIGTHLLREGRFAEAIPYFELISLAFLNRQNIACYAACRSYKKERWFNNQSFIGDRYNPNASYSRWRRTGPKADGGEPTPTSLLRNVKLDFCREMVQLEADFKAQPAGEARCATAYRLASALYQASYHGDCWFLSHYGKSTAEPTPIGAVDLADLALHYLKAARTTTNPDLRVKVLYAEAFIPLDPMCVAEYNENYDLIWQWRPQSRQFKAMLDLYRWKRTHKVLPHYVTYCDVLTDFGRQFGKKGKNSSKGKMPSAADNLFD